VDNTVLSNFENSFAAASMPRLRKVPLILRGAKFSYRFNRRFNLGANDRACVHAICSCQATARTTPDVVRSLLPNRVNRCSSATGGPVGG